MVAAQAAQGQDQIVRGRASEGEWHAVGTTGIPIDDNFDGRQSCGLGRWQGCCLHCRSRRHWFGPQHDNRTRCIPRCDWKLGECERLPDRVRRRLGVDEQSGKGEIEPAPAFVAVGHARSPGQGDHPAVEVHLSDGGQQGLALARAAIESGEQLLSCVVRLAQGRSIQSSRIRRLRADGDALDHQSVAMLEKGNDLSVGRGPRGGGSQLAIALGEIDIELRFQYPGFGLQRGVGKEGADCR